MQQAEEGTQTSVNQQRVPAIPPTEYTLILFMTHLATSNISYATIKVYLSAVRNMHVSKELHEFTQQLTPHGFNSSSEAFRSIKQPLIHPEFVYPLPSKSCMAYTDFFHSNLLLTLIPCFGQHVA